MFIGAGVFDDGLDAREEPGGGLRAVVGFVVAGVEGGEFLEVGAHVGFVEGFEEGGEIVLEGGGFGVLDLGFGGGGGEEAEVGGGGYVDEVLAVLVRLLEKGLDMVGREGMEYSS